MSTPELVVAILGTSSITAVIAGVITGLFNRRKMSAEATAIIQRAASELVRDLQKERESLQTRIDRWAAALQVHATWDHAAVTALARSDATELPPPPPLYPPEATKLAV